MNSALQEKVELAQSNFDDALLKGEGTFESRKLLKEAQHELSLAKQEEDRKQASTESKQKASRQRQASEMIEEMTSDLNATLENLAQIKTQVINLPNHLAENIIVAKEKLSAAQKKQTTNESGISILRQRQTELEAKRASIVQRRSLGNRNDDEDSKALILIDADLQGLSQLIDRKTRDTPTVTTHAEETAISEAIQALNLQLNSTYIQCLQELTSQLEGELVKAAQMLADASGFSSKDRYQPSRAIRKAAQKGVF